MPLIVIDVPPAIQLGTFALGWHGLLTVAAVIVAVHVGSRAAERAGAPTAVVSAILTWAIIGGLAGARLFFVIDHLPTYLADPLAALAIWQGGIAVYGAFIGGITAGIVAARRHAVRAWPLLDAAAPAMLVGQAIGRVGCLINGDAWGRPTFDDWGLVYRSSEAFVPPALLNVPTHPYPLYEIAAVGALFALLLPLRRRADGRVFLLAALGYAVIRFALTTFRQEAPVLGDLQQAQVVAVVSAVLALSVLFWRSWRAPGDGSALPAR